MPFVEHFCHIPLILGRKRLKYCTFFITLHALWTVFIPNLGTENSLSSSSLPFWNKESPTRNA